MIHPAIFIMIIIISIASLGAFVADHRQKELKPRTLCWCQTIPNISMYHRVPCKGTITRYRS